MDDQERERYWAKLHYSATGEVVLAACDHDLLGCELHLSEDFTIKVSEEFYMGESLTWRQLLALFEKATIINLLGDLVVLKAVEAGIIPNYAVSKVGGVSHVQIMR